MVINLDLPISGMARPRELPPASPAHAQRPEDGASVSRYSLLEAKFHFGAWSLLPAVVAIGLCLVTKEALTALFSGVVVGESSRNPGMVTCLRANWAAMGLG